MSNYILNEAKIMMFYFKQDNYRDDEDIEEYRKLDNAPDASIVQYYRCMDLLQSLNWLLMMP